MLRLRLTRKPCRVGRQECKRRFFVPSVLGEIEVHAANEVPGGMGSFEELLHGELGCGQFSIEGRIDAVPQVGQQGGRQIFCTGHRRNCAGHLLQVVVRWRRHRGLGAIRTDSGKRTQRHQVAAPELPPIRQHRWQNGGNLVGAQAQQSVSRAFRERLLQSRAEIGLQARNIAGWPQGQHPVRSENRRQHHGYFAVFHHTPREGRNRGTTLRARSRVLVGLRLRSLRSWRSLPLCSLAERR